MTQDDIVDRLRAEKRQLIDSREDIRAEAHAEIARLLAERQAVLDCINLYGGETLHKALDAIGWPNA